MKFFERFRGKSPEDMNTQKPEAHVETNANPEKVELWERKVPKLTEEEKQQVREKIAEMKKVLDPEILKKAVQAYYETSDATELDVPEIRTLREGFAFLRDHNKNVTEGLFDNLIQKAREDYYFDDDYKGVTKFLREDLDFIEDNLDEDPEE